MKTVTFLVALVTLCVLNGCSNVSTLSKDSVDRKNGLLTTIDEFNTAFAKGNVELLASMITENYLHTNGASSPIRKNDWINYLYKRKQELDSGILIVNNYEMDQVEIEFYQNTAIVMARVISSTNRYGEVKESNYRVTNLWVNENGRWKRAGFHDGKIK